MRFVLLVLFAVFATACNTAQGVKKDVAIGAGGKAFSGLRERSSIFSPMADAEGADSAMQIRQC